MNEARINEIKDRMRALMSQIMAMGEEPPEEIQDLLMQVIQTSQQQIQQLRQEAINAPPEQTQPGVLPPQTGPSNDAQLLWILAGQQPQAFISYLRTFPTAATQALLNNAGRLNDTIEQLSRMMPAGQPPVIDGIPHADLNSSNIWGAAYDKNSGKMRVRFQGGSEYEYDGVPANIFNAFIHGNAEARTTGQNQYGRWWRHKNPSMGAAMNQYIKAGGYPYRRLR